MPGSHASNECFPSSVEKSSWREESKSSVRLLCTIQHSMLSHMQVDDKWKALVGSCHAAYTNSTAHITTRSTFDQMWANYSSIQEVDATMETSLRLSSLLGTASTSPPEEMKAAKDVALKGFFFNESTAAGVYRGRLANFYWCACLLPSLCACRVPLFHKNQVNRHLE